MLVRKTQSLIPALAQKAAYAAAALPVEANTNSFTEKEKEAREEIWQNVLEEEEKKGTSIKYAEYPEEALKARAPSRR